MLWDGYTATIIETDESGEAQKTCVVLNDPEGIEDMLEGLCFAQSFNDSDGVNQDFTKRHKLTLEATKE